MFTYLNPEIRQRLIDQEKLVRINAEGQIIDVSSPEHPGELAVNVMGPIPMPMSLPGVNITVQWYAAVRSTELHGVETLASGLMARGGQHLFAHLVSPLAVNSVLVVGEPKDNPLVRVHSNCLTGDVFGSQRCDCGPQLAESIARISEDPAGGYLVYMAGHEGRGIGLWAKAATYLLQDAGEDTYEAKHFVGQKPFRLLTNNPKKIDDLAAFGLHDVTRQKHVTGVSQFNKRYLHAKQNWGHGLDDEDFQTED